MAKNVLLMLSSEEPPQPVVEIDWHVAHCRTAGSTWVVTTKVLTGMTSGSSQVAFYGDAPLGNELLGVGVYLAYLRLDDPQGQQTLATWLFSMDPMSFFPDRGANEDDNRLYPIDLYASLRTVWENFFASNQVGAISVFCFELMRGPDMNRYLLFQETTTALARNPGLHVGHFEVSYGNPHVGAVFVRDRALLTDLEVSWRRLHDVS
jgi:hypothetical protein